MVLHVCWEGNGIVITTFTGWLIPQSTFPTVYPMDLWLCGMSIATASRFSPEYRKTPSCSVSQRLRCANGYCDTLNGGLQWAISQTCMTSKFLWGKIWRFLFHNIPFGKLWSRGYIDINWSCNKVKKGTEQKWERANIAKLLISNCWFPYM